MQRWEPASPLMQSPLAQAFPSCESPATHTELYVSTNHYNVVTRHKAWSKHALYHAFGMVRVSHMQDVAKKKFLYHGKIAQAEISSREDEPITHSHILRH